MIASIHCTLLNQNVPHGLDVFVSVVWIMYSLVSTCVGVVVVPSGAKPNPGVRGIAIIFLISNDANSCLGTNGVLSHNIKTFSVAVTL